MENEQRQQTKPFAAWLQEQRNGALHAELSEKLAEVVAASVDHGKKGKLTLSVVVAPNKDGVTLTVMDDVKTVVPQGERGGAIFYPDAAGNLSRRDPRQPELPLREVTPPAPATTTTGAAREAS